MNETRFGIITIIITWSYFAGAISQFYLYNMFKVISVWIIMMIIFIFISIFINKRKNNQRH